MTARKERRSREIANSLGRQGEAPYQPEGNDPRQWRDPWEYVDDLHDLGARLVQAGRYGDAELCFDAARLIEILDEETS